MYKYWFAGELQETPVTVNCIRVSNVKVDIDSRYPNVSRFNKTMYSLKSHFAVSPEDIAKTYTYLATSDDVKEIIGKVFDDLTYIVGSSKYSSNKSNIDRVMDLSLKSI